MRLTITRAVSGCFGAGQPFREFEPPASLCNWRLVFPRQNGEEPLRRWFARAGDVSADKDPLLDTGAFGYGACHGRFLRAVLSQVRHLTFQRAYALVGLVGIKRVEPRLRIAIGPQEKHASRKCFGDVEGSAREHRDAFEKPVLPALET